MTSRRDYYNSRSVSFGLSFGLSFVCLLVAFVMVEEADEVDAWVSEVTEGLSDGKYKITDDVIDRVDLLKQYGRRLQMGSSGDDNAGVWIKYIGKGRLCDYDLMQAGISCIKFDDGSCCLPVSFGDKVLNYRHATDMTIQMEETFGSDDEDDCVFVEEVTRKGRVLDSKESTADSN